MYATNRLIVALDARMTWKLTCEMNVSHGTILSHDILYILVSMKNASVKNDQASAKSTSVLDNLFMAQNFS